MHSQNQKTLPREPINSRQLTTSYRERQNENAPSQPHTHIIHIFCQQILQCLSHSIALLNDLEPPVVSRAEGVGHERCSTDDGLQTFLEGRTGSHFVVGQWVHVDAFLFGLEEERETARIRNDRGMVKTSKITWHSQRVEICYCSGGKSLNSVFMICDLEKLRERT